MGEANGANIFGPNKNDSARRGGSDKSERSAPALLLYARENIVYFAKNSSESYKFIMSSKLG